MESIRDRGAQTRVHAYIALALITTSALSTLPADAQLWRTYTTTDGLVHNQVISVFQASDGALWFGTMRGGVSRYNGAWQNFAEEDGLADNRVQAIHESNDGAIWFATFGGGVSRYDGVTWQTYTDDDGLGYDWIHGITQADDGAMWFAARGFGASRFDGESWQTFEPEFDGLVSYWLNVVFQSDDGAMWFGTDDGVSRFDGTSWQTFAPDDGSLYNVTSILQASDGSMWFTSRGWGVTRYDGETWQTFTSEDGLVYDWVDSAFQSADGALWFATGFGVSRFDGSSWHAFTEADGLVDDDVNGLLQTADGTMWFVTAEGVSSWAGEIWHTFTESDGLAFDNVNDIVEHPDGLIWFATTGGVSRFDSETWQTLTHEDGLAHTNVRRMMKAIDGSLWFATAGGVSRFDGEQWQSLTTADGLVSDLVFDLFQSQDGAFWFGTVEGLSRFDGANWQTFTEESGLAYNWIIDLGQATDGAMWFATTSSFAAILSRLAGGDWLYFGEEDGLADDNVNAIYRTSDGAMWFGTWGGLTRLEGDVWRTFTQDDGLGHERILDIFESSDGALWLGTGEGGVSRFDGENWRTFTTETGLAGDQVRAVYQSSDGTMWFGTDRGVTRFRRPRQSVVETVILEPPPELLGSDRFFFQLRAFELGSELLPPLSHALTSNGAEPRPGDWSPFSIIPGFEQTDLGNGTWTFHVRSMDRYGNVDETPAAATFVVDLAPPTALITSPTGTIHGSVDIIGSILDNSAPSDLKSYTLEYAAASTPGKVNEDHWERDRIMDLSTHAVIDGVIGRWHTDGLHGPYVLRLSAVDSLNHHSEYTVAVDIVAAAAEIDPLNGSHVTDSGNTVDLHIPPGGLKRGGQITIAPVEKTDLALPENPALSLVGPAYALEPDSLVLHKPATFTLLVDEQVLSDAAAVERLALYGWSESETTWIRVGGTVDAHRGKLTAAISHLGIFALFADDAPAAGGGAVSDLDSQPRAFYPHGGGFAAETAISFTLGKAAGVTVKVYDRSGRFQERIADDQPMNAGNNVVLWDGRDHDGKFVPEGLYIIAVEASGSVKTKTVGVVID